MLHSRCMALITTLVASLSERIEPGKVVLHVDTVLMRIVICDVYPVGVGFDSDLRD